MTTTGTPDRSQNNRPTWRFVSIAAALIVFGLLLQIGCLTFQKVIDDHDLIDSVEQRGCGANPVDCFRHPVFELYYRPLFTATFAVGDHLHSKDAVWYHCENMVLHAAVCGLAFWFFYLLFNSERTALLAGLVFTLHPLQVTVTTFIGGRTDSLALFFLLLFAIGAWNATGASKIDPDPSPRLGWLLLSALGYGGAVFTKEQCLSLLLVLPLLLWRPGRSIPRHSLLWLSLYLLPACLYLWAAKQVIPVGSVIDPHWSRSLHAEMVGRTLWYFQRILFLPTVGPLHQSTLGPWDTPQTLIASTGYVLAGVWVVMIWRIRFNASLRFCALWATLTLLPCLNLIPIPSQFASCYRAVIPLLGVAGLLGVGLDHLMAWLHTRLRDRQPPVAWAIVAALLAFYSWETVADVGNWRNNYTLMLAELSADPNFMPAHHGLAFWAETTGDWKQVDQQFDKVISSFIPSVRQGESFVAAVDSPECQRALWSQAGLRYHPRAYLEMLLPHRGWARQQQGHFTAAAEDFRLTLLLDPTDNNSRANLRTCYMANGQVNEAFALYRNAAEVRPRGVPGSGGSTPRNR